MSNVKTVDPNVLSQTKKVRRVQFLNVPLYLGISNSDLRYLINQYLKEHYLKNKGTEDAVLCLDVNRSSNTVIVEFSSVEEANRVIKLEYMELVGVKCKVMRCSESMYGNQQTMVDKLQKIKNDAKAVGIAMTAMDQMITGESLTDNLSAVKMNLPFSLTRVIKISNLMDLGQATFMHKASYDKIYLDIVSDLSKMVTIVNGFIITSKNQVIGAEAGSIFFELPTKEDSGKVIREMMGKNYEGRQIMIVCIPENSFIQYFLPLQPKIEE